MKRILFIVPYPSASAPSQRFRFEQYFSLLESHDYKIEISSFWSERAWAILYQKGHAALKIIAFLGGVVRRCALMLKIPGYNMVFIHREAMPLGPPVIEYIIAKVFRKKIIYDFDDAIWLPNTSEQNSIAGKLKFHGKVKQICRWSWKVSCGNGFLADFAREYNAQVFINPTTIDTSYHIPKSDKNPDAPLTIGWTGTHSTTKYLEPLVPILRKLKLKYQLNILIISNQPPQWDFDDYEFLNWEKENEIDQLRRIDIGIMPLDDSIWEQGKCGFKALQYMSLDIPAVVSNVGVNQQIIRNGENGFLCNSPEEWEKQLSQLLESSALRKTIGEQGRQTVIESYSVISNSPLFLSLFA